MESNPKMLLDDCFAHDKKRLRHEEALAILRQRASPIVPKVPLSVADATGRILATTVVVPHDVPLHTNAAVDGFSFAAANYDANAGTEFPVVGRAAAGHRLEEQAAPGTAARIFTGAVMPEGHDTVVMQEDVRFGTIQGRDFVAIPGGLKRGANVRKAGEDIKAGEIILETGTILRPQDLAALASIGMTAVECFSRLKVGIVSTGDEVVKASAGAQLDSRTSLRCQCTDAGGPDRHRRRPPHRSWRVA